MTLIHKVSCFVLFFKFMPRRLDETMFLTPAGPLCCVVSGEPCCPCVAARVCLPFLSGRGLISVNILGNGYLSLPLPPLPMCLLCWSKHFCTLHFLLFTLGLEITSVPHFHYNGQFPCVILKGRQLLLHLSYPHSSDLLFLITVINNLFNIRQYQTESWLQSNQIKNVTPS